MLTFSKFPVKKRRSNEPGATRCIRQFSLILLLPRGATSYLLPSTCWLGMGTQIAPFATIHIYIYIYPGIIMHIACQLNIRSTKQKHTQLTVCRFPSANHSFHQLVYIYTYMLNGLPPFLLLLPSPPFRLCFRRRRSICPTQIF